MQAHRIPTRPRTCRTSSISKICALAVPVMAIAIAGAARAQTTRAGASKTASALPPLNAAVVRFCTARLDAVVGDGQCTALADAALTAAGAARRSGVSPGSGDYVWGQLVCILEVQNGRQVLGVGPAAHSGAGYRADVKPGDIIQFRSVQFRTAWTQGSRYGWSTRSYPHHTAVVESVSADGRNCKVFEQNVNGVHSIAETQLCLADMVAGWIRVYRPERAAAE